MKGVSATPAGITRASRARSSQIARAAGVARTTRTPNARRATSPGTQSTA
jgi:hypothetical protein